MANYPTALDAAMTLFVDVGIHLRRAMRPNIRSKRMKNANLFVDVDLTLVVANGKPLEGAREALQKLRDEVPSFPLVHLWCRILSEGRRVSPAHGFLLHCQTGYCH